jgi:hypothetical protein
MNYWIKRAAILCVSVALCSLISHGAIRWLGIKPGHSGYQPYGRNGVKPTAILYCSSLGYSAIDWGRVSEALQGTIESWATGGSSPSEWEADDRRSPGVAHTFIVVSPAEMNEYILCDFRAEIVPLGMAIRDLWSSDVDWELSRRILDQYPLMVVRMLFPTVGRSDGLLVGIRKKLRTLRGDPTSTDVDDAPKFGSTGALEITEKVTDWSPGRLQRRMVLMREACQRKYSFNGPKALALRRLLRRATSQGQVTMAVVPVSPFYQKEFLSPHVKEEFERVLVKLQHEYPQMKLIRLDSISTLDDNNMYYDLLHLNMYGEKIASAAFLDRMREYTGPQ